MKVAIIGGGASGVLCALQLKKLNKNSDITIYEASDKLLKKVSISGNGRCNLGNTRILSSCYQNSEIIEMMLPFQNAAINLLNSLGILTYADDMGRIYPLSNEAYTVVEILNRALYYQKVKVCLNTLVDNIRIVNEKYLVFEEEYDYLVVATGSNAGIKLDYNPYALVNNLALKMTKLTNGLVGFKVKEDISGLSGVKAKVKIQAFDQASQGELLFKKDGVSGICVMDLSIFQNDDKIIKIDLLPDYCVHDLMAYVKSRVSNDPLLRLANLMLGTVHHLIVNYLNKSFDNRLVADLTDDEIIAYLSQYKEFKLTIKESYDYLNSQVICGGVSFDEINNFEAKKYPNLFLCGEVLDEAGICGGYNLWFAFTSGIMVAKTINARC